MHVDLDSPFPARRAHSVVADSEGTVVMFGGNGERLFSDVWTLQTKKQKNDSSGDALFEWRVHIDSSGCLHRYHHAALIVGRKMLVVGGDGLSVMSHFLCALDLDTWRWEAVQLSSFLPPRLTGHSAVFCNVANSLAFSCDAHDGEHAMRTRSAEEAAALFTSFELPGEIVQTVQGIVLRRPEGTAWQKVQVMQSSNPNKLEMSSGEGLNAMSAAAHFRLTASRGCLVVFGGKCVAELHYRSDLFVIDLATGSTTLVDPCHGEQVPRPRASHTATVFGNAMFVYGGRDSEAVFGDLWKLDFESFSWSLVNTKGTDGSIDEIPCARAGHTATLLQGTPFLVVIGGWDGSRRDGREVGSLGDAWMLNLETFVWKKLHVPALTARDLHACTALGDMLLVVSGTDPEFEYIQSSHLLSFAPRSLKLSSFCSLFNVASETGQGSILDDEDSDGEGCALDNSARVDQVTTAVSVAQTQLKQIASLLDERDVLRLRATFCNDSRKTLLLNSVLDEEETVATRG